MLKKLVALFMVIALCFSLGACSKEEKVNVEDVIKESVVLNITTKVYFEYGAPQTVNVNTIKESDDNKYDVVGRFYLSDTNGGSYYGVFNATVEYNPSDGSASVTSSVISKLYEN